MAESIVKQPELVQRKTPPDAQTREDLRRLLVEMIRRNEAERKAKLR